MFNLGPKAGYGGKVKIEVFDRARYFTVTGNAFYEESVPIETRDLDGAFKLCQEIKRQYSVEDVDAADANATKSIEPSATTSASTSLPESSTSLPTSLPESSPVQIQKTGSVITSKSELMMNGKIISRRPFKMADEYGNSVEYPSQSEADMALCTTLALVGNDAEAITVEFTKSPLYREKWNRDDYRNSTISKAIETAEKIRSDLTRRTQTQTSADDRSCSFVGSRDAVL